VCGTFEWLFEAGPAPGIPSAVGPCYLPGHRPLFTDTADRFNMLNSQTKKRWLLPTLLLLGGFLMLGVDVPVARICAGEGSGSEATFHIPGDIRKGLDLSEVFGHGLGVALVGLALFALDREGRRYLPRILVCSLGGGMGANLVKTLIVSRTRPNSFDLSGGVMSSFNGPFPIVTNDHFATAWGQIIAGNISAGFDSIDLALDSALYSCPSAHTATAAGLAVALTWRYPHARWFFIFLTALVALQRIVASAHFVSDTFWGAATGCLVAQLVLHGRWSSRIFSRIEKPAGTA